MSDEKTQKEIEHDYWALKPLVEFMVKKSMKESDGENDGGGFQV